MEPSECTTKMWNGICRPLYMNTKDRDHENVRALETHPKDKMWKDYSRLCVVMDLQL